MHTCMHAQQPLKTAQAHSFTSSTSPKGENRPATATGCCRVWGRPCTRPRGGRGARLNAKGRRHPLRRRRGRQGLPPQAAAPHLHVDFAGGAVGLPGALGGQAARTPRAGRGGGAGGLQGRSHARQLLLRLQQVRGARPARRLALGGPASGAARFQGLCRAPHVCVRVVRGCAKLVARGGSKKPSSACGQSGGPLCVLAPATST